MKQILVMIAAVALMGCGKDTPETSQAEAQVTPAPSPESDPVSPVDEKLITDTIIEKAIRKELQKLTGELTEADLKKVTFLDLGYTQITDAGLKEVAKLKQLVTLTLWSTQITDAGLKDVAKLKNLERLFVDDTQITDAGLKDVAKLKKLTHLWLDDTQITDAGVAELKKALPNCGIKGP